MEYKILNWDTDYFGIKIGKISTETDLSGIESILKEFNSQKFELAYIEKPYSNSDLQLSPLLGELMDVKYIYQIRIIDAPSVNIDSHIRICTQTSQRLYNLAYQAGHDSRYKKDKQFADGEFERFYRTWIDNSINGQIARYVFGYFEDETLKGFITLAIKDNYGDIGLFAVDESTRGKGIGRKLMDAAYQATLKEGKSILRVATQMHNSQACKFYEKYGFSLLSATSIYHKWLNK